MLNDVNCNICYNLLLNLRFSFSCHNETSLFKPYGNFVSSFSIQYFSLWSLKCSEFGVTFSMTWTNCHICPWNVHLMPFCHFWYISSGPWFCHKTFYQINQHIGFYILNMLLNKLYLWFGIHIAQSYLLSCTTKLNHFIHTTSPVPV